jgi:toxin ParE1/3/4
MELIVAPKARRDIAGILAWTHDNFGPQTLKRYAWLSQAAIDAVATNPDLPGSAQRPEIATHCRTYHLIHSRNNAGSRGSRVRKPRQFLLYRVSESGIVEIGRVLHDSMELEQHLPEEYRSQAE